MTDPQSPGQSQCPSGHVITIWVTGNAFALLTDYQASNNIFCIFAFTIFPARFPKKSMGKPAGRIASCWSKSLTHTSSRSSSALAPCFPILASLNRDVFNFAGDHQCKVRCSFFPPTQKEDYGTAGVVRHSVLYYCFKCESWPDFKTFLPPPFSSTFGCLQRRPHKAEKLTKRVTSFFHYPPPLTFLMGWIFSPFLKHKHIYACMGAGVHAYPHTQATLLRRGKPWKEGSSPATTQTCSQPIRKACWDQIEPGKEGSLVGPLRFLAGDTTI